MKVRLAMSALAGIYRAAHLDSMSQLGCSNRPQMFNPSTLLRAEIDDLEAYKPIQPFEVLSRKLGIPADAIIKLDANENPYGPVPAVTEALAEYAYYHIYPDPQQTELRDLLSDTIDVPSANILSSHGADEMIDYICRLFLEPGDAIIDCPPTFGMYSVDARLQGAEVVEIWRKADHTVDIEAIEARVHAALSLSHRNPQLRSDNLDSGTADRDQPVNAMKLLFLTSPNNPSGTPLSDTELLRLLDLPLMIVLDEAYIEFSDEASRVKWVLKHDNLVVLRTFSKAAGMAGLRLGYATCPDWLMNQLWKFKQPYNVNVAATVAGMASLRHVEQIQAVVEKLKNERNRLFNLLVSVPYLRPYPSQSNFILCDVTNRSAAQLKGDLEKRGILVRHYEKSGLENCIRISVGRPDQTDRLLECLQQL